MRILFLLTQDLNSPGGSGRFLPLALELSRLGHEVRLAATHARFDLLSTKKQQIGGVSINYLAQSHVYKDGSFKRYPGTVRLIWNSFISTIQLARAALTRPVDLIYVCKPQPMNSIAGLIGRLRWGCPLVVDVDDDEVASGNFKGAWQRRLVAYFADHVPLWADWVTTNTYIMADKLARAGLAKKKIVYLPNGIDPNRFKQPDPAELDVLRRRLGLEGREVIVYVGSMSLANHPIGLLVEAFERLHYEHPSAALLLVGGGEDYDAVCEMIRKKDMTEDVIFTGKVSPDAVNLYYRLGNISIDPVYDNEVARCRCPLKLFESWACCIPFVSADVGDRRLLAGNPPAALLTQPGDPQVLADALLEILKNPVMAREMTQIAFERLSQYHWEVIGQKLNQEILAHRTPHKI